MSECACDYSFGLGPNLKCPVHGPGACKIRGIKYQPRQQFPFLMWLEGQCGYKECKILPDGRWCAINPLIYTHAIIVGRVGDTSGFDDRWCYHDFTSAKQALDEWNGTGEPKGWHRHPATGRRIDEFGEEKTVF